MSILEDWKEKVFFKEYLEDVSRTQRFEELKKTNGDKWSTDPLLFEKEALELLATKNRQNKDLGLDNGLELDKVKPAETKTTNIWSSFFSKQKPAPKEDAPQLAKHRDMSPKK